MKIQNTKIQERKIGYQYILISIIMLGIFALAADSKAAVIFEDNFDSRSDSHAVLGDNEIGPDNVWEWVGDGNYEASATFSSITHYGNEISSPGRGGTGKSYKAWRHSTYYPSVNYDGGVYGGLYSLSAANHLTAPAHFFMRYSCKIPLAFDFTGCNWNKWWRLNTSGGNGEIYFSFGSDSAGSLRDTGFLAISDYSENTEIMLDNTAMKAVWDGNWHSWEFEIDTANNVLRLWIDGELKADKNHPWASTGNVIGLQHFGGGNTMDQADPQTHIAHYQNSWQAMEIDDFVLSTTKIGPIDNGDTTPPATPSGLAVN